MGSIIVVNFNAVRANARETGNYPQNANATFADMYSCPAACPVVLVPADVAAGHARAVAPDDVEIAVAVDVAETQQVLGVGRREALDGGERAVGPSARNLQGIVVRPQEIEEATLSNSRAATCTLTGIRAWELARPIGFSTNW